MSFFLQKIRAIRYGAMRDRELGPLEPGLNVVFGANETGKTTFANLVGDVLYGWENRRGVVNTYRPEEGERCGALVFAQQGNAEETTTLKREGKTPPEDVLAFAGDVDKDTFHMLFHLTSDELLSLHNSSDVTARLLAAGSGTGASPAAAYVALEQQIALHTAPDAESEISAIALSDRLDELRERIQEARQQTELWKQKDRELDELRQSRKEGAKRVAALNGELEDLTVIRQEFARIDERQKALEKENAELQEEYRAATTEGGGDFAFDRRLLQLDSVREREIRDRLEEFDEEREKLERIADAAKENSAASSAAYEAFLEMDQEGQSRDLGLRRRSTHTAMSLIPTLAFIVAGAGLFIHGRHIQSLSFTVLGITLIGLAFLLAAAGVLSFLSPRRSEDGIEARKQDAQWVMLQDRKKMDASIEQLDRLQREINEYLTAVGLADAQGSLRRARALLDDAADARTRAAAQDQRLAAIDMRLKANAKELDDLRLRASAIGDDLEISDAPSLRAIDEILRTKTNQRAALLEMADDLSQRIGELSRELESAKDDDAFYRMEMEAQQLRTRLRESKHELIELLLAKRILERSMAAWESRNQPEVYREASRLFADMTDGDWMGVSVSSTGSVIAKRADGEAVKPRHLSLGTCQQLYLALRVALLLTAEGTGKRIPVLADDILVNFDTERRRGAARVLAELARHRQVVVFTCHQETVEALREAGPVAYRELV